MRPTTAAATLAALSLGLVGCASLPAAPDCDRACLEGVGEQYLAAMLAHDPTQAPFAPGARYAENGAVLLLPDGLWRTVSSVSDYRLWAADPVSGHVGVFTYAEEKGAQVLVSSRLRIENRMITEAEATVARFDAGGGGFQPEPASMTAPRPQFTQTLPPERRRPREAMIDIANTYFTSLENNDGSFVPNFADSCHRLENGFATTNRPLAEGQANPGGANMGCRQAFAMGFYRPDTRLRDRRFLAIDEERGLVFAQVFFDHDAVLDEFPLADGRIATQSRTAPWTWMIAEIFQIDDGRIDQVEAVLLAVPYGLAPAFDSGVTRPSTQQQAEIAAAAARGY
jgi:hypothetical protein